MVEVGGKRLEVSLPAGFGAAGAAAPARGAAPEARPPARARRGRVAATALTSPMQGTIVKVAVSEGDTVAEGDLVVVLEAMKMEQPLNAHKAGVVTGLTAEVGGAGHRRRHHLRHRRDPLGAASLASAPGGGGRRLDAGRASCVGDRLAASRVRRAAAARPSPAAASRAPMTATYGTRRSGAGSGRPASRRRRTSARSPAARRPRRTPAAASAWSSPTGSDQHLHRGVPGRERALVHLDQVGEEPLQAADQAPVHHHRPPPRGVTVHIGQIELRRLVEVDLDGGQAPLATGDVDDLHVDLRPVERRLARRLHEGHARVHQRLAQQPLGEVPARPGRRAYWPFAAQRQPEPAGAKPSAACTRAISASTAGDLDTDLVQRAEVVRVVERDRPDP